MVVVFVDFTVVVVIIVVIIIVVVIVVIIVFITRIVLISHAPSYFIVSLDPLGYGETPSPTTHY